MSYLLNVGLRQCSTNILKTNLYRISNKITVINSLTENSAPWSPIVNNLKSLNPTKKVNYCTRAYDVDTNVAKDVILFKYENPKFFKIINIFAISQFIFWTYLAHFAHTKLKDAPVEEQPEVELKWYQKINLGDNKYRNGLTVLSFLIGYGILASVWMFTLRSVRFLVLRKGGKEVSFVTYTPLNNNRIMTVPLKCISAEESREIAKVQLPIKVKNKVLFYVLDMRGEFKNPKLFDYTAGLKRRL